MVWRRDGPSTRSPSFVLEYYYVDYCEEKPTLKLLDTFLSFVNEHAKNKSFPVSTQMGFCPLPSLSDGPLDSYYFPLSVGSRLSNLFCGIMELRYVLRFDGMHGVAMSSGYSKPPNISCPADRAHPRPSEHPSLNTGFE